MQFLTICFIVFTTFILVNYYLEGKFHDFKDEFICNFDIIKARGKKMRLSYTTAAKFTKQS